MKTREDIVKKFHEAFDAYINTKPTAKLLKLRKTLIDEEVKELFADIDKAISYIESGKKVPKAIYANMLKEMADLQVVLSGMSVAFKPLQNFDKAFKLVHASNMSKLGKDGKPILREDGKIL